MPWTIKDSPWLEVKTWYSTKTYEEQKEESENKKTIPSAS